MGLVMLLVLVIGTVHIPEILNNDGAISLLWGHNPFDSVIVSYPPHCN